MILGRRAYATLLYHSLVLKPVLWAQVPGSTESSTLRGGLDGWQFQHYLIMMRGRGLKFVDARDFHMLATLFNCALSLTGSYSKNWLAGLWTA